MATKASNPPGAVPGVQRGCGTREEGGVYLESGLSEDGVPIEAFLADPPVPYEVDSTLGQSLVERDGTYHIIDWVGQDGYEYAADIVEEVRQYGLSRRVSKHFEFSKLTPESRIILVHARAVASDPESAASFEWESFEQDRAKTRCACYLRTNSERHLTGPFDPCTRFWYFDAEATSGAGTPAGAFRENAATTYSLPVPTDPDFEMESGIIGSFPLTRLVTIEAEDGSHKEPDAALSSCTSVPNVVQHA
jgi:hypothetical protein